MIRVFGLLLIVSTVVRGCPTDPAPPSQEWPTGPTHGFLVQAVSKEGTPAPSGSGALAPEYTLNAQARRGETITIRLPSNPTTGYTWLPHDPFLSSASNLVWKSCLYARTEPALIGSGGYDIWSFEIPPSAALHSTTKILLKYARPWDQDEVASQAVLNVSIV